MLLTRLLWIGLLILSMSYEIDGQVIYEVSTSINEDGDDPDDSAILDVQSSSQGVLIPRMSFADVSAIADPAIGLMVYDTDYNCLRMYDGSNWQCLYQSAELYSGGGSINVISEGDTSIAVGSVVKVDTSDQTVVVAGTYADGAVFGDTGLSGNVYNDVFVVKYNSLNNIEWISTGTGSDRNDSVGDIALDKDGNIYVIGTFSSTLSWGSESITSSGSDLDVFIAKLSAEGDIEWLIHGSGVSGNDEGNGIHVDDEDNLYVTGSFQGDFTLDGSMVTSFGGDDVFIAKLTLEGSLLWMKSGGAAGSYNDVGNDITTGPSGYVYVVGSYQDNAQFGSQSISSQGDNDIFILKYTPAGTIDTAISLGGTNDDEGISILVDHSENIYVGGNYQDGAFLGSGFSITAEGNADIFITKFDSLFSHDWTANTGSADDDYLYDMVLDVDGNIFLTGSIDDDIDDFSLETYGNGDIALLKVDAGGDTEWAEVYGGEGRDRGSSIDWNPVTNELFFTGFYADRAQFKSQILEAEAMSNLFLMSYQLID